MKTSFDVRVHGILTNENAGRTTYTIRWKVDSQPHRKTFATKALAESYRSRLLIAQREGTAFDIASGLPEPEARRVNSVSWLQHAQEFVDMKWPRSSPKHRVSIAEALATVTPTFLGKERGAPTEEEMRAALYGYAFNTVRRTGATLPEDVARHLRWIEANALRVTELAEPAIIRRALDALSLKMDGGAAAATTIARKRAVLSSALKYAVELSRLETHPFTRVSWTAPKGNEQVDRRTVVNPRQARRLLAAVAVKAPPLTAFFGCMYYAALRPEEALHLRRRDYATPTEAGGWGWLNLAGATVALGVDWSGEEDIHQDRALKHRATTATRRVPVAPELARLLDHHVSDYRVPMDGRLFVVRSGSEPGRPVGSSTYTRVWRQARRDGLTAAQQASPLAKVPYHLRHAAVSLWLNAGVPATQVAEWAGHSVHVLLKVYAACIDGEEDAARRRIELALRGEGGDTDTTQPVRPSGPE